jgi:SRSO17 transposase
VPGAIGIRFVWPPGMGTTESQKAAVAVLLEDCVVKAETLAPLLENLHGFLARYQPLLVRREQRDLGLVYVEGLLSALERKSIEPIATDHGRPRRALQRFVGAGLWKDDPLMAELRRHVSEELGADDGILTIDPSSFPKKGVDSVGVARQWCGRLGKTDSCQVGVYLGYQTAKGHTLVAHRLYLPKDWAADPTRRSKCHVPEGVEYRSSWQIADDLLVAHAHELPHRWIVSDEEFGRIGPFRAKLRARGEKYVLSFDATTSFEDLSLAPPEWKGRGRKPKYRPFIQAKDWAKQQKKWARIWVRDGEKEPVEFDAVSANIRARSQTRGKTPATDRADERLVVLRTTGSRPEYRYWVTNDLETSLEELVRVTARRHWIEDDFGRAKGRVGLGHYELRSWVGWHHHMTLACLALFFLALEQRRAGGKNLRNHRPAGRLGSEPAPAKSAG